MWNGTTVEISGEQLIADTDRTRAVAIYAPTATAVTLNGASVSFTRNGNYIYAAKVVNGFNPIDDTYTRSGRYADDSYPVEGDLTVKKGATDFDRQALLRFETSSYTRTITSAKLRVYLYSVGSLASRTIKLYPTTSSSWSENTVTYNNAPGNSTLITSATIANTDAGRWVEFDVSSYMRGAAGRLVSFRLVNEGVSTSGNEVAFYSSDYGM